MDQTEEEFIEIYRKNMTEILPQRDDASLLNYHEQFAGTRERHTFSPSKRKAIREAFMNIIDLNWTKREKICRESLYRWKSTPPPNVTEIISEDYWTRMKTLQEKYKEEIGESLCSEMLFVLLEYLDDRQDTDFDILMEERQKHAIDTGAQTVAEGGSTGGTENGAVNDATGDATSSKSAAEEASDKHFEKQLKLQMAWGRVIIFWKYWIDCRKESIDLLKKILEILEGEIPEDETNPVQVVLERISSQDGFENFLLQFAHVFNKDFACYKVLLQKLRDFLDLVTSSDYLHTFGVEPKDLFFNISTFQTNISGKQPETCRGFEICESIISRELGGLGETAKMLACTSRPLFHLTDLLRKLSDEGKLYQDGIQTVIDDLQQEETDMSTMFSESLLSFLEVSSKVNDAVEQLRQDIEEWLPKRETTIAKIKEIIEKLNKTTKDVTITQTVSSSVGILGGAIVIGGLILAPFTLGATLIPSAIAGVATSGLGAATAIGAAVTEIFIDKGEMEKATTCIYEDKVLFEEVANRVESLNRNSTMLIRYIPQDELESFISVITNPQSTAMLSISSTLQVGLRIAINIERLLSVGGKAVVMSVSRMVIVGAIATASRVAILAVVHSIIAIGVVLDIANLVLASVKLGKGAKSENAEKLEEVIKKMGEEKEIIEKSLAHLR